MRRIAWTVLGRSPQTPQATGGLRGGLRRAQGAVCQPAARRAREVIHWPGAGPAAGAGWLAGRAGATVDSSKLVRDRSRNVRCNHSWNHACCEASDPGRDGHSAGGAN